MLLAQHNLRDNRAHNFHEGRFYVARYVRACSEHPHVIRYVNHVWCGLTQSRAFKAAYAVTPLPHDRDTIPSRMCFAFCAIKNRTGGKKMRVFGDVPMRALGNMDTFTVSRLIFTRWPTVRWCIPFGSTTAVYGIVRWEFVESDKGCHGGRGGREW